MTRTSRGRILSLLLSALAACARITAAGAAMDVRDCLVQEIDADASVRDEGAGTEESPEDGARSREEIAQGLRERYKIQLPDEEHARLARIYLEDARKNVKTPAGQRAYNLLSKDFRRLARSILVSVYSKNRFMLEGERREEADIAAETTFFQALLGYRPEDGPLLHHAKAQLQARARSSVMSHLRQNYGYGKNQFERSFYWNRAKVLERLPKGRVLTTEEVADGFNDLLVDKKLQKKGLPGTPENRAQILAESPERATPQKVAEAVGKLRKVPGIWLSGIDVPASEDVANLARAEHRDDADDAQRDFELATAHPEHGFVTALDAARRSGIEGPFLEANPSASSEELSLEGMLARPEVRERIEALKDELDPRERAILERNLLAEKPESLRKLCKSLPALDGSGRIGISNVRAGQIRQELVRKLTGIFSGEETALSASDSPERPVGSYEALLARTLLLRNSLDDPGLRKRLDAFEAGLAPRQRLILRKTLHVNKPKAAKELARILPASDGSREKGVSVEEAKEARRQALASLAEAFPEYFLAGSPPADKGGTPRLLSWTRMDGIRELRAKLLNLRSEDPAFAESLERLRSKLNRRDKLILEKYVLASEEITLEQMANALSEAYPNEYRKPPAVPTISKHRDRLVLRLRKELAGWLGEPPEEPRPRPVPAKEDRQSAAEKPARAQSAEKRSWRKIGPIRSLRDSLLRLNRDDPRFQESLARFRGALNARDRLILDEYLLAPEDATLERIGQRLYEQDPNEYARVPGRSLVLKYRDRLIARVQETFAPWLLDTPPTRKKAVGPARPEKRTWNKMDEIQTLRASLLRLLDKDARGDEAFLKQWDRFKTSLESREALLLDEYLLAEKRVTLAQMGARLAKLKDPKAPERVPSPREVLRYRDRLIQRIQEEFGPWMRSQTNHRDGAP